MLVLPGVLIHKFLSTLWIDLYPQVKNVQLGKLVTRPHARPGTFHRLGAVMHRLSTGS